MSTELPKTIYKYRNWREEFHKNVLLKNELYLSSPKDLNDPFDSKFFKNYELLDSPEKIEQYLRLYVKKYGKMIVREGYHLDKEIDKLRSELQDIEQFQRKRLKIEEPDWDLRNGILSLSSRWDSILMWSHYGDFHGGYCIGFNEVKMRKSGKFGGGGIVNYTFEFPIINPLDDEDIKVTTYKRLHYKSKEWEYEKEYRLRNFYYPEKPKKNDRIVTVPDDFIEEVIVGLNITPKSLEEIVDECRMRNIKLFQCMKKPLRFGLSREEI